MCFHTGSIATMTPNCSAYLTIGLNYPLLLKKIKEHKPYVHCTLENTVPENAVATREFMERTYASV